MPTLMASAPASIRACAPSAVATLPAITWQIVAEALDRVDRRRARPSEWPWAVSTTITSTSASSSASARFMPSGADAGGGGDAQAALLVLAGIGEALRLLDILDGDQADAAIGRRPPPAASRCGTGAAGAWPRRGRRRPCTVISRSLVISSRDGLALVAGEAHVAVGQDADQLAAAALDHREAGDLVAPPSRPRASASGLLGMDGQRIDHHAGFELLDPADFLGLLGGCRGSCG